MNTQRTIEYQSKTGSALLAVMGIVFLIAAVVAGVVVMGRQQIFSSVRLRDAAKAQMIAEAGVNDAYNLLKTNFAARYNPSNFPIKSFDGGIYDTTVNSVGTNKASIISTGIYGSATAVVKADVKNFASTTTNGAPIQGTGPYGFAVLAGGNLNWAGNSDVQMSNGWMHCNAIYSANGANTLRGNVEACGGISLVGGANITGTGSAPTISGGVVGDPEIGTVPLASIPNIDLTPYYNAALANNQVFSSGKSISGTVTPPGGIMWVNGTLYIGTGNFTGCFIATGGIELKTAANDDTITLTKVNSYPVLASRDNSILVKQAKTLYINGLVYCKTGTFDKQGNGDVIAKGAIIAAGDVSKNGGWTAMIWSDPTPVAPNETDQKSRDKVVITAWQD